MNEPLKAVALKYDSYSDEAPRIISKGEGILASEIINIARKEGIKIHRDKAMVAFLSTLDLEEEIPPELYEVVSNLLCFVYKMDREITSENP